MSLGAELELALELADAADAITLPPFSPATSPSSGRSTAPRSPRSTGPPRRRSPTAWPPPGRTTALLGEEHGRRRRSATRRGEWIVDPIDGTSGYVRGIPVWATLIALAHDDDVVVGVVSAPALGRRWWATAGGGTFAGGRPCRVSTRRRIADAQVSVTISSGWERLGLTPALVEPRPRRAAGPRLRRLLAARPRRRGALDVAVDAVGVGALRHRRRAPARRGGGRDVHRPRGRGDPSARHGDQHQRPAARRGAAPAHARRAHPGDAAVRGRCAAVQVRPAGRRRRSPGRARGRHGSLARATGGREPAAGGDGDGGGEQDERGRDQGDADDTARRRTADGDAGRDAHRAVATAIGLDAHDARAVAGVARRGGDALQVAELTLAGGVAHRCASCADEPGPLAPLASAVDAAGRGACGGRRRARRRCGRGRRRHAPAAPARR